MVVEPAALIQHLLPDIYLVDHVLALAQRDLRESHLQKARIAPRSNPEMTRGSRVYRTFQE